MSELNRKSSRVLITGGAGFIGSELVRQVAAQGAEVTILDNLVNGNPANIEKLLNDRIHLEVADIRDHNKTRHCLKGIDHVFHLACLGVRHSIHSPQENHEVNATATLSLLSQAREAKVKRFVYVSTSEVYGSARTVPITEDHPARPHTVYGASKLAGECYTRAFWETYRSPTTMVRAFNSFGPRSHHEGDSGEVIPKFLLRGMAGRAMVIFGDGRQTRDFTFVTDTARGILLAGFSEAAIGETINIGNGKETSIREVADLIAEVLGKREALVENVANRPGDVLRLCADTRKARRLLGFRCEVSLRKGLEKLRAWYEDQGIAPQELLKDELTRNWVKESVVDE